MANVVRRQIARLKHSLRNGWPRLENYKCMEIDTAFFSYFEDVPQQRDATYLEITARNSVGIRTR